MLLDSTDGVVKSYFLLSTHDAFKRRNCISSLIDNTGIILNILGSDKLLQCTCASDNAINSYFI